jgi:hypothetical protein
MGRMQQFSVQGPASGGTSVNDSPMFKGFLGQSVLIATFAELFSGEQSVQVHRA